MTIVTWKEVIDFWFDPKHVPLHFAVNEEFDELIHTKFLDTWKAGADGLLVHWRKTIKGRLAEIIVLDQFSRNLWRNDIRTYTQDKMALVLAQEVLGHPDYDTLSTNEKKYILLPFMHSESLEIHNWAYRYFEELGEKGTIHFEKLHKEIIEKFGRYPYRNKDLLRQSTPEELKYLEKSTFKF